MSEKNCKDCFVLGQRLEMAQQEIRSLRDALRAVERDVNDAADEAARAAAVEQSWRDSQGDDYGSY